MILLLSIWAKYRIRETGILLSVGKSKWEILAQRMAEMVMITVLAFGMAYFCGDIAANEVGNRLLSLANEQNTEEAKTDPSRLDLSVSAENYDLTPVFLPPKIEELSVDISADIIAAVFVMELLVGFASISIAWLPVWNMKPKRMDSLQKNYSK